MTQGCLSANVSVLTMTGTRPVSELAAGDRIITRSGSRVLAGIQKVAGTGQQVCISPSALGVEKPGADVVVGAQTRLMIRDWRAKALTGEPQAVVAAIRLVDGEYIRIADTASDLYALDFGAPVVIYADGLEVVIDAA